MTTLWRGTFPTRSSNVNTATHAFTALPPRAYLRLGGATAQAQAVGVSFGEDAPNLVVLLRDTRLRMVQVVGRL